jgi:hypothetical protein
MKHPRTYIVLTVVAVALALGVGCYYYVAYYIPEKEADLTMISLTNSKPTIQALYNGQYDAAIANLRSLIKQAPTKTEKARLQELLMAALYDKGSESETAEAASITYSIINDYSVPAWIRAMTYNTTSRVVYAHDLAFYKTYFNKAPLSDYINVPGTDDVRVQAGYLKMLQASDEIYPTSFAEYNIAGHYFMVDINNIPVQQTREELAALMQKYVVEGDTRDDSTLYAPYTIILNQLTRARAITLSNKILGKSPDTSEQAYKRVKAVADSLQESGVDMNNSKIQAVLLTWRFAYADFLLTVVGSGRTADIQKLLVPFGTTTSKDVIGFLVGLNHIGDLPSTNVTRTRALKLAAVSPEFKAFLIRTGVSF